MAIDEQTIALANSLKDQGNNELKQNNFDKAVELYSKAIELNPNEIYFSNRAQAQIKLENYGLAINDSNEAIKLNKDYVKSYYRRAIAYSAITDYKKSLSDVKIVLKVTKNKDVNALKLEKQLVKLINQIKFEKAIHVDDSVSIINQLDFNSMIVENWYSGPELDIRINEDKKGSGDDVEIKGLDGDFIEKMIELFKKGEKLPKKYVFAIVSVVNQLMLKESSLVEIGLKRSLTQNKEYQDNEVESITICGDTHGQFYDVLNIFNTFGNVGKKHTYLFNGDFVDRGSWSCEVALLLYCLKIAYPSNMYINRGNHETNDMNKVYGFEDECKFKYSDKIFQCFAESFNSLPFATLIGQEYLIMHGGLFSDDNVTLDDIRKITRGNQQPPKSGIEMELLWTDPQESNGRSMSKRGIGIQFGPDITKQFCDKNNLKAVIRSHEVRMNGYEFEHDNRLITVFSAPNYCDVQGNLGAVINLTLDKSSEYELKCETFKEVEHPNIPPMNYTKSMGL